MAGMIITFCFLVLYTSVQPYCTPSLSKAQACCLISQFFGLFSGICLEMNSYVQYNLGHSGQKDTTGQSSAVYEVLIIGVNIIVCICPMALAFMSEEFSETREGCFTKFKSFISGCFQDSYRPECKSDDMPSNIVLTDSLVVRPGYLDMPLTQANTSTVEVDLDQLSDPEVN